MGEMQGREVELDVTGIAHGGTGVARLDGRVVFVQDAIPGERVVARVSDDRKKSFWRADTVRVLEASEHRRPHVWSAASVEVDPAGRAGGAEFGHVVPAHQRELKRQVLADALGRFGDVDATVRDAVRVEALPGDDERGGTGWRTRVRLHVDPEGRLGPRAARSHHVVPVDDLPLATAAVRETAPLDQRFPGEESVDVLATSTGGARLVVGRQAPSVVTERVGDREFRVDDTGFWQVHEGAAEALTRVVRELVDPALFDPRAANLDLYGGVGLFAAALGDLGGPATKVTSVEGAPRATGHAAENLAEWVGAAAVTGRVERWLREQVAAGSPSERARRASATVVLDPPRSGAGADVVDALVALDPAQVVYVACDPVALSRDLGLFGRAGWRPAELRAVDLFPSTHHLETVVRLTR